MRGRNTSGRTPRISAPITGPQSVPMPPRTTMDMRVMDSGKPKSVALMKRMRWA